jgi:hypothetical protein
VARLKNVRSVRSAEVLSAKRALIESGTNRASSPLSAASVTRTPFMAASVRRTPQALRRPMTAEKGGRIVWALPKE